ncbi:MAG: glycosyltransferase [Candidatus Marinimicrobia bacterium]|nr:glycosyltransferase [Candidatus Neomarinimicrobiota bacterium]
MSTDRPYFFKHKAADFQADIKVYNGKAKGNPDYPLVSVIIPTLDGYRYGYFPELLKQLGNQKFQDFETIVVKGDPRQGRAINTAVSQCKGKILIILDDDTQLGTPNIFSKLVETVKTEPNVGMVGVPNLVPENGSWIVKAAMKQIPRRSSPMVEKIVESDLAEHPCCAIPKDVFINVGGENEKIPRGVDPYLRSAIRDAGYRVVVIPKVYIHHQPPNSIIKNCRQFFRNGKMAAYVNKFHPYFVIELASKHEEKVPIKATLGFRIIRYIKNILFAIATLKWFYLLMLVFYAAGFIIGYLKLDIENA